MPDTAEILNKINGQKIMIVGDLMLDTFIYGDVDRISPESPVPVLKVNEQTEMLGGAGNVVSNLCALGVEPLVFSTVGNDAAGERVISIAQSLGANVDGIMRDETRPTILKTRYVARSQQLLRMDVEKVQPLPQQIGTDLLTAIKAALPSVKIVILSDYGKGVLSAAFLAEIISAATDAGVKIIVDPKGTDFSIYRGAFAVTPNKKELAEASGIEKLKTDQDIIDAAQKVITSCGIENVIATRSEDGMSVIGKNSTPVHISTQAREVFDVSGAGDTVIAVVAACLSADASLEDAARIANVAAGLAVAKVGTASVAITEIQEALNGATRSPLIAPVKKDWGAALEIIRIWKAKGLKVGMTGGCFDIIHYGHVNYVAMARTKCDRLVVALNHDASVRILKGPERPVNDEQARATVMAALGAVDMVVFFGAENPGEDNTPAAVIDALRPDIFFKGGDYTEDQLPEAKIVRAYGGDVAIMTMFDGYSTTKIIEKSRQTG